MQTIAHKCDICGALKKEANHWFHARKTDDRFVISHWETMIVPDPEDMMDLCGVECATKAMLRALQQPL